MVQGGGTRRRHEGDTEGKEEEPKAKNEETDSEVKMGQKGGGGCIINISSFSLHLAEI